MMKNFNCDIGAIMSPDIIENPKLNLQIGSLTTFIY